MAETVDELLVKLGLETDAKSFKQADNQFANLKTTALKTGLVVGAAFAATGAAAIKMSGDAAHARDDFSKWADSVGVAIDYADRFRHAVEMAGGTEMDSRGILETVNNLRDAAHWGEMAERSFESIGFSPSDIQGMNIEDATDFLMRGLSQIKDEDARRRVAGELGFSGAASLGVMTNADSTQAAMDRAEELGVVQQSMLETSASYVEAMTEAERAMRNLKDMIAEELLPGMEGWMRAVTGWTTENKDGIKKTLEFVGDIGPETRIGDFGRYAADDDVQDMWGGIGSSLLDGVQYMNDVRPSMMVGRELRHQFGGPTDWFGMGQNETPKPDAASPYQPFMAPSYTPDFSSVVPQSSGGGHTSYYTIDARGSTDPGMTEEKVRRVFDEQLNNAVEIGKDDFPNNVK